jgi:hypothetical protein
MKGYISLEALFFENYHDADDIEVEDFVVSIIQNVGKVLVKP